MLHSINQEQRLYVLKAGHGFSCLGFEFAEMRRSSANLIPACEAAWEKIKDDFSGAWDWEFLPIVVSLWIEADFDASAVTVEKIVAAAKEEG